MILRTLFEDDVAVAETDPREVDPGLLLESELAEVANAVLKRRREYAAGRILARDLLARLGSRPEVPLLAGEDRAPSWPAGFVGAITHCADLACVAVAPSGLYASLGCDVEERAPISDGVARRVVCTAGEWAALGDGPSRNVLARVVFSAKETFYKLQYPLTQTFLGFEDAVVTLDLEAGSFELRLVRDAGPFSAGARFAGGLVLGETHIGTAMAVRAGATDSRTAP